MLKTRKAKRLLSKWEQSHLTAVGINRVEDFDERLTAMATDQAKAERRSENDVPVVVVGFCPTCWGIGKKLKMI